MKVQRLVCDGQLFTPPLKLLVAGRYTSWTFALVRIVVIFSIVVEMPSSCLYGFLSRCFINAYGALQHATEDIFFDRESRLFYLLDMYLYIYFDTL